MQRRSAWRSVAAAALVLAALLAFPPAADARKLQMSGTWAVRHGWAFIPFQFASPGEGPSGPVWTTAGDLSMGRGTPNGPIPGAGGVSATGSSPATLVVPGHRFQIQASAIAPLAGVTLVQITTMFAIDGPVADAVLAPGGGPGSFTWCPNAVVGCPATGFPNGGVRNGRVIYRAGANQFGGSMRLGLANGGSNSFVFDTSPFWVGHVPIGPTAPTLHTAAVGAGTASMPATGMLYLPLGLVTQPTTTPTPNGLILHPGPRVTTRLGLSTTGSGSSFRPPTLAYGPMGTPAGQITSSYGFAHTTGTVIVQQTAGTSADEFFTVMGSDMRTALGAGNISTVAGGISFRNTLAGQTPYATFHRVWLSLAPPVPSLAPGGAAAAGVLLLLGVGYAQRRGPRKGRSS